MSGSEDGTQNGIGSSNSSNAGNTTVAKRKAISYGPESVESWGVTEMEQETFAFLWTLKGSACFGGTTEVKSPLFRGGPNSHHLWQLKVNPNKKSEEQEFLGVHLILQGFGDGGSSSSRKLKARFQISLLDSNRRPGKQAGSATMNVCEFKRSSVWGFDNFITISDLMAPTGGLVNENTINIHCRVWIEGDVKHKTGNGGAFQSKPLKKDRLVRYQENLSKQLGALFRSTDLADLVLKTKTKSFMVHKAILVARSEVFARMLSTTMLESKTNNVEITDFDEDVVADMLEFMYTGHVEGLQDIDKASSLLKISEKYNLPDLKEESERSLAENLSVETAAEVLVMAHVFGAMLLKPKVIDFINRNKEDIRKTSGFLKVAELYASLFVELYLSRSY